MSGRLPQTSERASLWGLLAGMSLLAGTLLGALCRQLKEQFGGDAGV
ncbi:LPXTG cell wall anchor domain-containing protein [Lactiplantibacillus pentosus]